MYFSVSSHDTSIQYNIRKRADVSINTLAKSSLNFIFHLYCKIVMIPSKSTLFIGLHHRFAVEVACRFSETLTILEKKWFLHNAKALGWRKGLDNQFISITTAFTAWLVELRLEKFVTWDSGCDQNNIGTESTRIRTLIKDLDLGTNFDPARIQFQMSQHNQLM